MTSPFNMRCGHVPPLNCPCGFPLHPGQRPSPFPWVWRPQWSCPPTSHVSSSSDEHVTSWGQATCSHLKPWHLFLTHSAPDLCMTVSYLLFKLNSINCSWTTLGHVVPMVTPEHVPFLNAPAAHGTQLMYITGLSTFCLLH